MINFYKLFFLTLFSIGFSKVTLGQDKMLLRAKPDTLLIKIIEIGSDEVRYKLWPIDSEMPIMVEKKDRIRKIVFANGTVIRFAEDEFSNPENYSTQKKMAIKMDMFSPIRNVLSFSCEYSIKPGISLEGGLGYIGVASFTGNDWLNYNEADGGFIRAGIKFINQPDYYLKGMRYTHILKGAYIKPEIMFLYHENFSSRNYYSYWSQQINRSKKLKVNGAAVFLNFGKQWVFSDIFCVDFYLGPGIGYKKVKEYINGNEVPYGYTDITDIGGFGFITFTDQVGKLAFCAQTGLKVGILIGTKKSSN
jgi:hypothetical protein